MGKLIRSCFLFAMPRPLFGAARTLDLGAQFDMYNYSTSDAEADARALYSDWLAIGDDLISASTSTVMNDSQFHTELPEVSLRELRAETRTRARA